MTLEPGSTFNIWVRERENSTIESYFVNQNYNDYQNQPRCESRPVEINENAGQYQNEDSAIDAIVSKIIQDQEERITNNRDAKDTSEGIHYNLISKQTLRADTLYTVSVFTPDRYVTVGERPLEPSELKEFGKKLLDACYRNERWVELMTPILEKYKGIIKER